MPFSWASFINLSASDFGMVSIFGSTLTSTTLVSGTGVDGADVTVAAGLTSALATGLATGAGVAGAAGLVSGFGATAAGLAYCVLLAWTTSILKTASFFSLFFELLSIFAASFIALL